MKKQNSRKMKVVSILLLLSLNIVNFLFAADSEFSPGYSYATLNLGCGGGQGSQIGAINGFCVQLKISTPHGDPCMITIDWGDGNVYGPAPVNDGQVFTYCYSQCGWFTYYAFLDCDCDYILKDSILITVPVDVDIQTQGNAVCEGIPVTLEAIVDTSNIPVTPPLTYYWDFGTGDTAIGNPVTYAYPSAGTYVGTVRVEDASGCWGETQFVVVVEPTPRLLTNDIYKCKYDTVPITPGVMSGTPPYSWNWTPNYALTCNTCQNTNTYTTVDTTYYITVTDVNGCYSTDSVRVNIFPQPVLTAEPDTICPRDTTTINITLISGTSPFQWQWTPPNDLSCNNCPAPLVYPDTTTLYEIKVTDANGCWDTAYALVFVWPKMNIFLPDTHFICLFDSATLSPVISGGTPPYIQFTWIPDSALSCDTCLQTDAYPRDTTTYIIRILDSRGCYHYDTTTVIVWPLPELRIPDTSICMYDTILIYPGGPYVSYSWTPNYNISCTFCDSVYVWPHDTTRYKVIATNQFGCVDSTAGWVNPVPWPIPMLPDSIALCQGEKVLVYAGVAASYEWNPQQGLSCVVCDSVYVFPQQNALYIVTYKNEIGCTLYDTMKVYVAPAPNARAYPDHAICLGSSTTISAEGGYHYHWMPAELVSEPHFVNPDRQPTTHTVSTSPQTTTTFLVAVNTDTTLCQWDTASVTVFVDSGAFVQAISDTVVLLNDTAIIKGLFPDSTWRIDGKFPTSVFATWWQQQEGAPIEFWEPLQTTTPVVLSDTGKWWFYFFAQTTNGCISYDSVLIHVIYVPCSDSVVFHPLAFTPNRDGVNDELKLYSQRPAFVKLWRIYDRWGNLLYEQRNFIVFLDKMTAPGWDGTYDGRLLRPDVYVYYLFVDCDGTIYFKKGDVTLIR